MKEKSRWVKRLVVISIVLGFIATEVGLAQDKPANYPNKAITLMVGFSPGGSSDVGARVIAEALQ